MEGTFQYFYGFQYERVESSGPNIKFACIQQDCEGAMILRTSKDFILVQQHNHPRIEVEDAETAQSYIVVAEVNNEFVKVFVRSSLIFREGKCKIDEKCEFASLVYEKTKGIVKGIFNDRNEALELMIKLCEEYQIDLAAMDVDAKTRTNPIGRPRLRPRKIKKNYNMDVKGDAYYPLVNPERPACYRQIEEEDGELLSEDVVERIMAETEIIQKARSCCQSEQCLMKQIITVLNRNTSELATLRREKKAMWTQIGRLNRRIKQYYIAPQPVINKFQPKFHHVSRDQVDKLASKHRNPFVFAKKLWAKLFPSAKDKITKTRWRDPAKIHELQCIVQAYFPTQHECIAIKRWHRIWKQLIVQAMKLRKLLLQDQFEQNEAAIGAMNVIGTLGDIDIDTGEIYADGSGGPGTSGEMGNIDGKNDDYVGMHDPPEYSIRMKNNDKFRYKRRRYYYEEESDDQGDEDEDNEGQGDGDEYTEEMFEIEAAKAREDGFDRDDQEDNEDQEDEQEEEMDEEDYNIPDVNGMAGEFNEYLKSILANSEYEEELRLLPKQEVDETSVNEDALAPSTSGIIGGNEWNVKTEQDDE
ncbi:unnamed protein product [Bursaphelenchus okinawaensis]|uniref:Uncharacterized protein n=1 Tax=Bursaphelenchus okinawaensis TaxID=465554 RepID=A0A811L5X1_9BILA|nr:unnamed protein product [Bursaphelenchus okinawaensis]CAG9118100.1 unnamed protein product [Bursaphelenchus okinawaensis]